MTLTELFNAIAAAIRAKDGTTASIPALTFPERIMALSGGGGGGPFCTMSVMASDNNTVAFGPVNIGTASVSVTAEEYVPPKTHALYNGVRLPKIPESLLASYPYAWIRKNTTSGYYDLIMSDSPYYYSSYIYEGAGVAGKPYYRVPISSAGSATGWTNYGSHGYTSWGLDANRTVLWSNHDIPNGSATATDIYFEGTEPVPTD